MFQNYTAKKVSNVVDHFNGKLEELDKKIQKENQKISGKEQEVKSFLEVLGNKITLAKNQKEAKEKELMDLKQSKLEALDELMQAKENAVASEIREANKKLDILEERMKYVQRDLEIAEMKADVSTPYAFNLKDRKRLKQLLKEYDELKKNKELFSRKFSIGAEMVELAEALKRSGESVMRVNNPSTTGHVGTDTESVLKRSSFFNELTTPEQRNFFNGYFEGGKVLKVLLTLPEDKGLGEYINELIQNEKSEKERQDNKPYMLQRGFN